MKIWTIQDARAYEQSDGSCIIYDINNSDELDIRSYRWMLNKLNKKSGNRGNSMIWGWRRYGSSSDCPDLNDEWLLPQGTKGVCLEIEVPDRLVVLSQFEMWNWILNDNFIPVGWEEASLVGHVSTFRKYRSWSSIFDLSFGDVDYWGECDDRSIQAVFPYLDFRWIKDVTYFCAR